MDVSSKDPQVSSSVDGKFKPDYTPSEVLNPDALLPTPKGSLPSLLPRNLGPLDKNPGGLVRKSSDQS